MTKNIIYYIEMEGHIAKIMTSFIEIPGCICSSVYMTGCAFNCHNCQNKDLQKLTYGFKMSVKDVVDLIDENHLAKWVCFLGGEPFFQPEFLLNICQKITKPIGIYTGNNYDEIINNQIYTQIINLTNVLYIKTGRFDEELITIDEYPITKNQEVRIKYQDKWLLIKSREINTVSKIVQNMA